MTNHIEELMKAAGVEKMPDEKNNFVKDINDPSKEQTNDSLKNQDKNFNEKFTQEKEPITIDGLIGTIDEWARLVAHEWGTDEYSDAEIVKNYILDINKQLARKTQECEELKESNKKAQELYKYFMDVAENTANKNKELENNLHIANTNHEAAEKECDRYREALEEIEKVCIEYTREFADGATVHYYSLDEILDIINKAKGEE